MRRTPFAAGVMAVAIGLLSGCVTPAPTTADYEAKAAMSAQAAVSAARTAIVAARAYTDGKLQTTYLETTVVDAEDTLGAVQTTFTTIQPPPSAAADRLRDALEPLLQDAGSAATDLRIAVRRNDRKALSSSVDDLATAADKLDTFAQEHRP
jgi:histidinol-phosphate/aromatic aminotransferase/cobyric acid decarboxylase-like protein